MSSYFDPLQNPADSLLLGQGVQGSGGGGDSSYGVSLLHSVAAEISDMRSSPAVRVAARVAARVEAIPMAFVSCPLWHVEGSIADKLQSGGQGGGMGGDNSYGVCVWW